GHTQWYTRQGLALYSSAHMPDTSPGTTPSALPPSRSGVVRSLDAYSKGSYTQMRCGHTHTVRVAPPARWWASKTPGDDLGAPVSPRLCAVWWRSYAGEASCRASPTT